MQYVRILNQEKYLKKHSILLFLLNLNKLSLLAQPYIYCLDFHSFKERNRGHDLQFML